MTTTRTLQCPRCGAEFQTELAAASGRRVLTRCPSCGRDMVIDSEASSSEPSAAPFASPLAAAAVLLVLTLVGIALAWPWREARVQKEPPVASAPARTDQPAQQSAPPDTADTATAPARQAGLAKATPDADATSDTDQPPEAVPTVSETPPPQSAAPPDNAPPLFPDPAHRPDAAAEAALREAATAQQVMMGDYMAYGVSEAGALPGSGGDAAGSGAVRMGEELLGPMKPATTQEDGAFLAARDRNGKARGQGFTLPAGVFFRADATRTGDSHVVYARHRDSGRAFAWDAEGAEPWICENSEWVGQSGILARSVPVTPGKNDLADQDCAGRQIRRWTRLSAVNPTRDLDESAESLVRNSRTTNEVLMGDYQLYGSSAEGVLPPFQPVTGGPGQGVARPSGGQGAELLGPLEEASEKTAGAYLVAWDKNGTPHGLGLVMGVPSAVYLRVDVSPAYDSAVHYARHSGSGRVFAADSEHPAIFVCENSDWQGESGILARPVEVTAGKNDLEGQDCGGKEIPHWTNLDLVRRN